jgi:hypothetical protein
MTDQPQPPSRMPLPRQIRRREVFAFIAVVGEELHMPHRVEIREYHHNDRDWHVIDLNVGTEADVRWWAAAFGHASQDFSTLHYSAEEGLREGVPWSHYSSSGEWRGWLVSIKASVDDEPAAPDEPLDEDTTAALREIAGGDQ